MSSFNSSATNERGGMERGGREIGGREGLTEEALYECEGSLRRHESHEWSQLSLYGPVSDGAKERGSWREKERGGLTVESLSI